MNRAMWAVVALAMLAGCTDPPARNQPDFDGQAAWQWVHDIVYDGDALRPRHMEAEGRTVTAAFLADALRMPGWEVRLQNFTGAEYLDAPKPPDVSAYLTCSRQDEEALPAMLFQNVVATRREAGSAGHLALGAHWDAKEDAYGGGVVPAANDGASGMGLLLQLQRHLGDARLGYDLTILFFDGEDGFEDCHPLAGSIIHAQDAEYDRFILLDMVGDIDARFVRETNSLRSDPAMMDLFWDKAPEHGLEQQFTSVRSSVADDHIPFLRAGIPSIDIIDLGRPGFPPYWHTTDDTPDQLEPEMLGMMGDLLVDVLHDPTLTQWP